MPQFLFPSPGWHLPCPTLWLRVAGVARGAITQCRGLGLRLPRDSGRETQTWWGGGMVLMPGHLQVCVG